MKIRVNNLVAQIRMPATTEINTLFAYAYAFPTVYNCTVFFFFKSCPILFACCRLYISKRIRIKFFVVRNFAYNNHLNWSKSKRIFHFIYYFNLFREIFIFCCCLIFFFFFVSHYYFYFCMLCLLCRMFHHSFEIFRFTLHIIYIETHFVQSNNFIA